MISTTRAGPAPSAPDAVSALGLAGMGALGLAALALVELGLGRAGPAAEHLEELLALPQVPGSADKWRTDLVEAYVRLNRRGDAERELERLERHPAEHLSAEVAAAIARCRGLLAPDDELRSLFTGALAMHRDDRVPFERARTQLCFGERLRRARRRAEARLPLRAALDSFEELGALPWAERARREVGAAGESLRLGDEKPSDGLTEREVQVGQLVADGLTNRQIGSALFISPKTVEYHLRSLYSKLAAGSRTDLARRFASTRRGDTVWRSLQP